MHDTVPLETLLTHRSFVAALARALVQDPVRADDLEQQAWLAAFERPPAPGGSIRSWFGRVLRNAARDSWRSRERRERREREAPRRDEPRGSDEIAARAEVHRRVVLAVFSLEEAARRTVILRFFEGLSTAEIAEREGVTAAAVRKRIERALTCLREMLDAETDGDRRAWVLALLPLGGGGTKSPPAPAATLGLRGVAGPLVRAALVLAGAVGVALWFVGDDTTDAGRGLSTATTNRGNEPPPVLRPIDEGAARDASAGGSGTTVEPTSAARESAVETPSRRVGVTVVSYRGEPVEGATVTLMHRVAREDAGVVRQPFVLPAPATTEVESRADAVGRCTVEARADGRTWIVASAPGHAPSAVQRVGQREDEVRLTLRIAARVEGRVLDAVTGDPVEAEVFVSVQNDRETTADGWPWLRSTAGASGEFRFDDAPAEPLRVLVRRPGGLIAAGTVIDGRVPFPLVLRVPPDAAVSGVAIDVDTNEPVAGAALHVVVNANVSGTSPGRVRVRTDAQGRFSVDQIPASSQVAVWAERGPWHSACDAHGHVLPGATGVVRAGRVLDTLRVPLRRGGAIAGTVRRADGSPAGGAVVRLTGRVLEQSMVSLGRLVGRGEADDLGRYRIEGLAPGHVQISASCGNELTSFEQVDLLAAARAGQAVGVEIRAGQVTQWDVALETGLRVAGRVVDSRGAPVEGASVVTANRRSGGDFAARARTDADGRFVLEAIPRAGASALVVAASAGDGSGRTVHDPDSEEELTIRLPGGRTTDWSVAGRVLDEDGKPVPAARVVYVEDVGDRFDRRTARPWHGRTVPLDGDGHFGVEHLSRHRKRIGLFASAPGFLAAVETVHGAPGLHVGDVRLELTRGAAIRGVLLDHGGAEMSGVPVRAVAAHPGSVSYDGCAPTAVTAVDGSFSVTVEPGQSVCLCFGATGSELLALPSAPAGRTRLVVRLPEHSSPRDTIAPTIDAGGVMSRHRDEALPRDAGQPSQTLAGRVVDGRGMPVAGATVTFARVTASSVGASTTSTDHDGRFRFTERTSVAGVLEVDAGDLGSALVEGVVPDPTPLALVVSRPDRPTVSGVVRSSDGDPVAGAVVLCVREFGGALTRARVIVGEELRQHPVTGRPDTSWNERRTRAGADGSYAFDRLPRGNWVLLAGTPGAPSVTAAAHRVRVDAPVTQDLVVGPGAVLRAVVRTTDGSPRRGERVKLRVHFPIRTGGGLRRGEMTVHAVTGGDGELTIPGLPPGPWELSFVGVRPRITREVAESEVPVDIRF